MLERFYALLSELRELPGQGLTFGELTRAQRLPIRGVYFICEPGETIRGPGARFRVVRVGTHAVSRGSRSTLWGRLRAHRGTRAGGGNHRGSVFRLHVGNALKSQLGIDLPTWGRGSTASRETRDLEGAHEQRVSAVIRAMPVLWVDVPDEPGPLSHRSVIEQGAVALLSNRLAPLHPPSATWLGRYSSREEIRRSGLWNLDYVDETPDPAFLELLEGAIRNMEESRR
jgi:hypothetical protein